MWKIVLWLFLISPFSVLLKTSNCLRTTLRFMLLICVWQKHGLTFNTEAPPGTQTGRPFIFQKLFGIKWKKVHQHRSQGTSWQMNMDNYTNRPISGRGSCASSPAEASEYYSICVGWRCCFLKQSCQSSPPWNGLLLLVNHQGSIRCDPALVDFAALDPGCGWRTSHVLMLFGWFCPSESMFLVWGTLFF